MDLARHRTTITGLLYGLVYLSVIGRAWRDFAAESAEPWPLAVPLALLFGLLMATERRLHRRYPGYLPIYLAIQALIALALLLLSPGLDYFVLLFGLLCSEALILRPFQSAIRWTAVLTLLATAGLVAVFGWADALPLAVIYVAAFAFISSYASATRQAEEAQQQSHSLLAELQEAHQQLQAYAEQAREMAVVEERSRLARDLHDSVTQALYSLTLYAEAASRQLATGDIAVTAEHLVELQRTAQEALGEMRLLIFELRPQALEDMGLAAALRARLEAVESRAGLKTELQLHGDGRLPAAVEEGLYRIAQESLNNVLKHAQASQVCVSLTLREDKAILEVNDDGTGFVPSTGANHSGLGLRGMQERALQLGGELTVSTGRQKGTLVRVEVSL